MNATQNEKRSTWNTQRNLYGRKLLVHPSQLDERAPKNHSRNSHGNTHPWRASQANRLWTALGALCLSFGLSACGSGSDPVAANTAFTYTRSEVAALSSVKCEGTPVVGVWKALHTGQGSSTYDTVEIGPDCFFQTYACGTIGYIDSDVSKEFGIAEVVYLGNVSTMGGCPPAGRYRCNYRISAPYYKEMVLDCLPN